MRRIPSFLLLGVLWLMLSACSGASNVPATPTSKPQDLDIKPLVRDFLANLPADWNLVTSQQVAQAKPFIVDVRQPEEYAKGFIDGAVNIPIRELAKNLTALPAMDKDVVVVCSSGHRSAVGMMMLQLLGYKKAKSLQGGMASWQATRLPVVTAPAPARATNPPPPVNAQLQAMLDYYLGYTLPLEWGAMDKAALTEDQLHISSAEETVQPETFDQGRSLLIDVDSPEEFVRANLPKDVNAPLKQLPTVIENLPIEETVHWA